MDIRAKVTSAEEWVNYLELTSTLRRHYSSQYFLDESLLRDRGSCKFLFPDRWLSENIRRCILLDLDKAPIPLDILDLGTGTGLFPFCCNAIGHHAVGIDLPLKRMFSQDAHIFSQAVQTLKIRHLPIEISPFLALPIQHSFDLITGFMTGFNVGPHKQEWGHKEWAFLIADLCSHLKPGGRIVLRLVDQPKYGNYIFCAKEVYEFFERVGKIEDCFITISANSEIM